MPPRIATYADPEASQALLEQRDRNMFIMDLTSELPWIKPLHVDVGPDGAIAPAVLRQFLAAYKRELVRRDLQPDNLFLGGTSNARDEERFLAAILNALAVPSQERYALGVTSATELFAKFTAEVGSTNQIGEANAVLLEVMSGLTTPPEGESPSDAVQSLSRYAARLDSLGLKQIDNSFTFTEILTALGTLQILQRAAAERPIFDSEYSASAEAGGQLLAGRKPEYFRSVADLTRRLQARERLVDNVTGSTADVRRTTTTSASTSAELENVQLRALVRSLQAGATAAAEPSGRRRCREYCGTVHKLGPCPRQLWDKAHDLHRDNVLDDGVNALGAAVTEDEHHRLKDLYVSEMRDRRRGGGATIQVRTAASSRAHACMPDAPVDSASETHCLTTPIGVTRSSKTLVQGVAGSLTATRRCSGTLAISGIAGARFTVNIHDAITDPALPDLLCAGQLCLDNDLAFVITVNNGILQSFLYPTAAMRSVTAQPSLELEVKNFVPIVRLHRGKTAPPSRATSRTSSSAPRRTTSRTTGPAPALVSIATVTSTTPTTTPAQKPARELSPTTPDYHSDFKTSAQNATLKTSPTIEKPKIQNSKTSPTIEKPKTQNSKTPPKLQKLSKFAKIEISNKSAKFSGSQHSPKLTNFRSASDRSRSAKPDQGPTTLRPPLGIFPSTVIHRATAVVPKQLWQKRLFAFGPKIVNGAIQKSGIKTTGALNSAAPASDTSLGARHRLRNKRIATTSPVADRFQRAGVAFGCDFAGKFLPSIARNQWLLLFIDQSSNTLVPYFCKRRSEFLKHLKTFTRDHPRMELLYTDNERTMLTPQVEDHLKRCKKPIDHRQRPPGESQARYAGRIERAFGTLMPALYTALFNANLSGDFWEHAISHICRVWNIVNAKHKTTEKEMQTIAIFGCVIFWKDTRHSQREYHRDNKGMSSVSRGIHIGYNMKNNCWRIYCPRTRRIVESDSVTLDESSTYWRRGHRLGHPQWHEAFDAGEALFTTLDKLAKAVSGPTQHYDDMLILYDEPSDSFGNLDATDYDCPADADVSEVSSPATSTPASPISGPSTPALCITPAQPTDMSNPEEPVHIQAPELSPDFLLDNTDSSLDSSHEADKSSSSVGDANYFDITSQVNAYAVSALESGDFNPMSLFHGSSDTRLPHATVNRVRTSHKHTVNEISAPEHDQFRPHSLTPSDFCLYNAELNECVDFNSNLVFSIHDVEEPPQTLAQARQRPDAAEWIESYEKEVSSLMANNTWTARRWRDIPAGRRAIRCKLVFRKKMIGDKLDKYKCRIVAKGFSQVKGLDYFETWAPTVRDETVKICLTHAATSDFEIEQSDVSTAFLNPDLNEQIFMHMPDGMANIDDEGYSLVLELNKCIYGLKQSANAWFAMLTDHITNTMGFTQSDSDPCLFFKDIDGHRYLLLTFVDDILLIGPSTTTISDLQAQFSSKFKMTHLGPVAWFLQMEVTRDRTARTITLNNRHKISSLLEAHGMTDCKPVTTPMVDGKERLRAFIPEDLAPDADLSFQAFPYREIVGSLLYLTKTRLDLQLAIQQLCKYMHNHGPEHVVACKRVLRYLKGTLSIGLTLGGASSAPLVLSAYADADWARDLDYRTSITGYTLFLGRSCINSVAKNQDRIALSSTEAEYIAICVCSSKIAWARQVLADVGLPQLQPTIVYEDNQPCIDLAHNAILSERTMHVDVKYHKIRERIKDSILQILPIPTDVNVADTMTKPLARVKFELFRAQLMLPDFAPAKPPAPFNRHPNPGDVTSGAVRSSKLELRQQKESKNQIP